MAIACLTREYLAAALAAPTRVPLLLTRDLLFAGSHALEGAIDALAAGGTAEEIRKRATQAYADGERKPIGRVRRLFAE